MAGGSKKLNDRAPETKRFVREVVWPESKRRRPSWGGGGGGWVGGGEAIDQAGATVD